MYEFLDVLGGTFLLDWVSECEEERLLEIAPGAEGFVIGAFEKFL